MPMCVICGQDKAWSGFNHNKILIETNSERRVLICEECE